MTAPHIVDPAGLLGEALSEASPDLMRSRSRASSTRCCPRTPTPPWALSTAVGAMLVTAIIAAAGPISSFFGRSDLQPLVRVLALFLLASAVCAVPEALLRRSLLFRRLTVATVARSISTSGVSIGLALAGLGAWALVWGALAGSATYAAALWLVVTDRRDVRVWRVSRADVARVLRYGIPVAGGTLLAKLIFDVDYLVVGRVLGAQALGYYTLAFRLPELLIINVFFVISSVTFPLYSQAHSDRESLRRGYLLSVRIQSLYELCAGAGIAAIAPLLVPLAFGEQWRPAVGPVIALAVYAACRSLGAGANDVYKAIGRPGLSVTVSLVRLVALAPVLLLATRWNVEGVAWAQAGMSLLFVVLMQGVACQVIGLSVRDLLASVAPGLLAGTAVTIVANALCRLAIPDAAALALAILGGMLAAGVVLLVGFRPLLRELVRLIRHRSP